MWNKPPNLETTAGKLKEVVRVFLAVLTSPLFIIWVLLTGKWRYLSAGFVHLFSPLAMLWVLVTRRELHIHIGRVMYQIAPRHGPGPTRVGALFYAWRKDQPR